MSKSATRDVVLYLPYSGHRIAIALEKQKTRQIIFLLTQFFTLSATSAGALSTKGKSD
jgi:hypothetical protein